MASHDSSRQGAGVLLIAPSGRVLLVRRGSRASEPGTWAPPGGHLEQGESPREAAAREAREEVGIDVPPLSLCLVALARDTTGFVFYTYAARVPKEAVAVLDDESTAARWVALDALPRPVHPGLLALLEDEDAQEALVKAALTR